MQELQWVGRHSRTLALGLGIGTIGLLVSPGCTAAQSLPDSPGALLVKASSTADVPADPDPGTLAREDPGQTVAAAAEQSRLPPCGRGKPAGSPPAGAPVVAEDKANEPCTEVSPIQPIVVAAKHLPPMTPRQKGYLAFRDVIDPFNVITITANAGVIIAANAHTAYGPGFTGFGRLVGYSFVEDIQGEFIGTFLIPTLAHEDPRYYRRPGRTFPRRLLHAVAHTVITRHDDGTSMPNYATLLTYPISAELINLYVPGVAGNAPDTAKRVGLGLVTNPVGDIVAEFLPDVAKRIHIRVIFLQQILQQVAQGGMGGSVATQ